MSAPRIVTPQEAQRFDPSDRLTPLIKHFDLVHTVATEPDRIAAAERAAVVKALRERAESLAKRGYPDVADLLADDTDLIENGADL